MQNNPRSECVKKEFDDEVVEETRGRNSRKTDELNIYILAYAE
jgi:hypothetical protein